MNHRYVNAHIIYTYKHAQRMRFTTGEKKWFDLEAKCAQVLLIWEMLQA